MAIPYYFAMTAAEVQGCLRLPETMGWLSCRFSPYSSGLTGLPQFLQEGSVLILTDSTPMSGHDPERIASELGERVTALKCSGVLLDFCLPGNREEGALAESLSKALPCPVGTPPEYPAQGAAVFLPPPPLHIPLEQYLAPWRGKEVWLDTAPETARITLTEKGASVERFLQGEVEPGDWADDQLHCRYRVALEENKAVFTLIRDGGTLQGLLEEAGKLGVTAAFGLYQQWRDILPQEAIF